MTLRPRVRIEYILILLSALSFAVTALCTSRMMGTLADCQVMSE